MADDSYSDTAIHMHLEEAEILKKQWFSHVFETLNRLHEQIADNSRQAQKDRDKIHNELVKLKDDLLSDLRLNAEFTAKELEKVENRLQVIIKAIEEQFTSFRKEDFKKLNEKVNGLGVDQKVMSTKLAAYVAMLTIGVTSVLGVLATGILMLFKDAIKAWIGA